MNNPAMMNNPMMFQMMMNYNMMMNNPMMMQMMMNNPMMNNPNLMGGGGNINMMNPEQRKQYMRYLGYLKGKEMAEAKKRKEGSQNIQTTNAEQPQIKSGDKITIKFKKGGKCTKIKIKADSMIAELLNTYSQKTNDQGPFKYKGNVLNIEDCSSLIETGMRDGDEIIVG